ncbi:MAG: DUF2207 domain-containing protein [Candidatus Omnitrophica bacterium]|nr:DUF2207 domain-containing protein [Candidatus Omnitrophota bacterium]
MKRTLLFFLPGLLFAPAPAHAWQIDRFETEISIQADSGFIVREKIEADFKREERHGIYREIPLVTQDRRGVKRSIRLTFLEAADERGERWGVKVTRQGVTQRIRLGDPDRTFSGRKVFQLTYQVERALQAFPDHDELYWNVTGNQWAVPMGSVSAKVRIPQATDSGKLQAAAYTGTHGSAASDVQIVTQNGDSLLYAVTRPLRPFEGLTIVAGFPPGIVSMPGRARRIGWFFQDNRIFALPLLTLLLMGWLWRRIGRDFPIGSVAVSYEPPEGLTPAEVGCLIDDQADLRDITASIVDLARRGYLSIEQLGDNDYLFNRAGKSSFKEAPELKTHEKILLDGIFGGGESASLSQLENEFYVHLPKIREALYRELTEEKYWWNRPDMMRNIWWAAAGLLLAVGLVWGLLAGWEEDWGFVLAILSAAGIIAAFAPLMPRKSWRGARAKERILGLEEFLRRTDEDRLRRESNPAALFERLLPFAMALGVANQWARAFEGIYRIEPSWYQSYDGNIFTPSDFTRRLHSAAGRMETVFSSVPRSSGGSGFGGGFSGGGGGGGGGGAW